MESNNQQELPWPLIAAALQGELSGEDEASFRAWLAESSANREEFDRLERLWKEGLADYPSYMAADAARAWNDMQVRLDPSPATPRIVWRQWLVGVAALVIIATGVALIRRTVRGKRAVQYETAVGEFRRVVLPDGATMELEPGTSVTVEAGYNQTGRSVLLMAGEAHFDVLHKTDQPFTVETKNASIRDIGTVFTVSLRQDSISVAVTSGKIAFIQKQTGQTQEVAAGSSLIWNAGEPVKIATAAGLLRFDNARLSDVVAALGAQFGKKVLLADTALASRRLTIDLGGESFDAAMKVICASLDLQNTADSNGFVLKPRVTR